MPYTTDLIETEVNHFFNVKIGISEPTMVKLREEGIKRLENLVGYNSEDLKGIVEALREPGGLVPSSGNARASIIPAPGVWIGARALIRLEAAMEMMKHYETVNHEPTAGLDIY